jgi:pyruvate/2-oxoglutarate dehydrogenase complex dihydrolipoamide dehydrogenase (E3) component
VILGVGSRPFAPSAIVAAKESEDDWLALDVRDALTREIDFGDNVIVYVESRYLQGLVTADFCLGRGANVRIVVRNTAAGGQIDDTTRQVLFRRLGEAGVPWTFRQTLTKLESEDARVTFTDLASGSPVVVEDVSALIYDCGVVPDTKLAEELGDSGMSVHSIGDCVSPRNMVGAVKDGARVVSGLI